MPVPLHVATLKLVCAQSDLLPFNNRLPLIHRLLECQLFIDRPCLCRRRCNFAIQIPSWRVSYPGSHMALKSLVYANAPDSIAITRDVIRTTTPCSFQGPNLEKNPLTSKRMSPKITPHAFTFVGQLNLQPCNDLKNN